MTEQHPKHASEPERRPRVRPTILTTTGALRAWWSLAMVLVVAILLVLGNVAYTNSVQTKSDRDWCDLLASLDSPQAEPTTERGRAIRDQIHDLRKRKGCLDGR